MHAALELRVLAGRHRDARCAIHDGATVGSDSSCDVVLSDDGIDPRAARIHLTADGWSLNDDVSSSQTPATTTWNEAQPLGQAWITVASEDAPWVSPDATAPAHDADESSSSANNLPASEKTSRATSWQSAGGTPTTTAEKKLGLGWPTLLVLGAVTLLVLSAIALVAVSTGTFSSKGTTSKTMAEQSLGKISAALERLGLSSTVHVALTKAGTVTVSGWVRDKAQYEALAAAMSQIWPMPGIRISLESEAILTARSILQRFSVKFDSLYQGNGRLEIVGIASSARERASALDAVRAQLSGLTVFGNSIELAEHVSDALAEKLNQLGLAGVTLTWKPGHLEVQPPALDDAQEAKLTDVIDAFNKEHWDVAQLGNVPDLGVASSVPFTIRSVIGGPQPFIVLADGSKLLVGGTYKKHQLTAVEDTRIIFDGPRRAIVTR